MKKITKKRVNKFKKPTPVFPKTYLGKSIKWIDNKPFYNKGCVVVIRVNGYLKKITLLKISKNLNDISNCLYKFKDVTSRSNNFVEINKYVYSWNDGVFNEHSPTVDAVLYYNTLKDKNFEILQKNNELLEENFNLRSKFERIELLSKNITATLSSHPQ